jgi:hypothetical protein
MLKVKRNFGKHTFSTPDNTRWGWYYFIERNKLENIKEGEKIKVKVEIRISEKEIGKIKLYFSEKEKQTLKKENEELRKEIEKIKNEKK